MIRRNPAIIGLAAISFSYASMAIASSVCDIALNSGAFNTSDYSHNSRLFLAERDAVCQKEYDSKQEATTAARKSGGNIGYAGFSFGASDAKQTSSGKWSLQSSEYCRSSASQLDSITSTTAKGQVADVALGAWLECVKLVETDRLFVAYSPLENGRGITGTIHRRVSGGAVGEIRGISGSDPSVPVTCQIGTTAVTSNEAKILPIERANTSITCIKEPSKSVRISLITSVSDSPWIDMPSQKQVEQTAIDDVNEATRQLREQVDELQQELTAAVKEAKESALAAHKRINGISLTSASISQSPGFGCSQTQKAPGNDLTVMYGSKDGTGCGVMNANFYKTLKLNVPAQ